MGKILQKEKTKMKKFLSQLMSIVLLFSVGAEAFAAYPEDHARAYEIGSCAVTYTVQNEWDNYRQIHWSDFVNIT